VLEEMTFNRTTALGIQSDDALKIRGEMLALMWEKYKEN